MPHAPVLIDQFRHLEEALWLAPTRYDRTYMDVIFAKDCFEFGRSGRVWSREELLEKTGSSIDVVLPLPEFAVRAIAADVMQVTYISIVRYGTDTLYSRRASIWSRIDNPIGWQLRFHQGTPFTPNSPIAP